MSAKERTELAVFREFAKVCPLPLLLDTAKNRQPPEPDILCGLIGGGEIAFELVSAEDETADKANPGNCVPVDKLFGDNFSLKREVEDAYFAAVEAGEIDNPERFYYRSLHIHFEESASFKKSVKSVAEVVRQINGISDGANIIKQGVIRSIECDPYPIPCDYKGPLFYANSSACNVGLTVVGRVRAKLKKRYETNHPIHLLVYSGSTIATEVEFWRADLVELIAAEGMGPFDHIWVFGTHKAVIAFELARPV